MQDPLEALKAALKESVARYPELKNTRRTIRKIFYVTPQENQQIDKLRQGVSQSRFFRTKVLGQNIPRPKPAPPYINRQSYQQLNLIRRDINRIANALNRTENQPQTELTTSDRESLQHLKSLLVDIQRQMTNPPDSQIKDNDD